MRKRIDVLESKVDVLENACVTMQRKFDILINQCGQDKLMALTKDNVIFMQGERIKKLEALHRDDYK